MVAFDPLRFLDVASDLVSSNQSEPALRTGIGRVYYAIYLVARERLLAKGIVTRKDVRKKSPHGSVINGLKRLDSTAGQQLGSLFDLRVQADYHLQPSAGYRDWLSNWARASSLAQNLQPKIQRI